MRIQSRRIKNRNRIIREDHESSNVRVRRLVQALDVAGEDILPGMIGADMLIQIAALLRSVGAIRTLELGFLAALVSRVSQQGAAMLVTLAASLTTIRECDTSIALLGQTEHKVLH